MISDVLPDITSDVLPFYLGMIADVLPDIT
jgi:hypothetical protein